MDAPTRRRNDGRNPNWWKFNWKNGRWLYSSEPIMKPEDERYDLYGWFDGSCQPTNQGGYGGWGIVLKNATGELLNSSGGCLGKGPHMSNNVAEHHACANLLELIADLAGAGWRALVRGDSNLVINQIRGRWKAKRGLYIAEYHRGRAALSALVKAGVLVEFAWIPRERNEEADALSTATDHREAVRIAAVI